jgi:hypothetical protein
MQQGYEAKRDYEFHLHVQTLRSLRMVAFYSGNFKKGTKPEKLFSLPMDDLKPKRPKLNITQEDIKRFQKKFRRTVPKEEIKTKRDILGYD